MFTIGISKGFSAWHHLGAGGACGSDRPHRHRYRIAVRLEGDTLNGDGFLADVRDVEKILGEVLSPYRDRNLNDFPEFLGTPTMEALARFFCRELLRLIPAPGIQCITVEVRENPSVWSSYTEERIADRTSDLR
ncbi:MAG: 6-carboxytetrahydropterin synthase [Syntrophales bacterium]|nr:6-carboxytetrahydropterin synthase [Syntrophales bacterium]MDD5234319.1 6-carboxytetrahydropterin synthase [Syntrophales bacterium]MDD5533179.1 6-carboxytetrahydropterin synthase [Syntrophales bacterium]